MGDISGTRKAYLCNDYLFGGIFAIPVFVLTNIGLGKAETPGAVLSYIISVAVFAVSALLFGFLLSRMPLAAVYSDKRLGRPVLFATLLVFILLYAGWFVRDYEAGYPFSESFWWNTYPPYMVAFIIIIPFVLFMYGLIRFPGLRRGKTGWGMRIFYLVAACIYPLTTISINPFATDMYHLDAYIHPIYNIWFRTPYSDLSYSIYGHYEMFYMPLLRLFGTSPFVVTLTAAFICFSEALLIFYIFELMTSSRLIKIAAAAGLLVPGGVLFRSMSLQTTPHRLLFPLIVLSVICCRENRGLPLTFKFLAFINPVLALSFLWNLETGVICCAAVCFYIFCHIFIYRDGIKRTVCLIIIQIMASAADLLAAVAAVNVYNLAVSGKPLFRSFFYPYINGGFMGNYYIEPPSGNVTWTYLAVMAAAAILLTASRFLRKGSLDRGKDIAASCTAVVLFGSLTYYISRAAYFGILITVPYALILLVFWADKLDATKVISGKLTVYEGVRQGIGTAAVFVLSGLLATSLFLPFLLKWNYDEGLYDLHVRDDEIEEFLEIEPDTYAIGWGLDEIYGYYGWDTGYHFIGTSDVIVDPPANAGSYVEIIDQLKTRDRVLVNDAAREEFGEYLSEYDIERSIEMAGDSFH